jgi:hypothetical protein
MRPDEVGGSGAADSGGGGGALTVKKIKVEGHCLFTSLLERAPAPRPALQLKLVS